MSYHHFTFSAQQPGVVVMKEFSDSVGTPYTMLSDNEWCPLSDELPQVVSPAGLSLTRQWYVYRQIREYCKEGTEDVVCPKPSHDVDQDREEETMTDSVTAELLPPPKKARRCGNCGGSGHTRRTCKKE